MRHRGHLPEVVQPAVLLCEWRRKGQDKERSRLNDISRVSESEHEAQESIISVLVLFDFFVGRG